MKITDLKLFAEDKGIKMPDQKRIASEVAQTIAERYGYSKDQIKRNFDQLLHNTEKETYNVYLKYQKQYGEQVIKALIDHLIESGELRDIRQVGSGIAAYFELLDKFFLSLSQSRRVRAGASFEEFHNTLFKKLNYPFDEQRVINGKPDFIMPSYEYYLKNPIDCIIYSPSLTLDERWRKVRTKNINGLWFYFGTMERNLSKEDILEIIKNKIYIICPKEIKDNFYSNYACVLSYAQFFRDHIEPALERWERNGVLDNKSILFKDSYLYG